MFSLYHKRFTWSMVSRLYLNSSYIRYSYLSALVKTQRRCDPPYEKIGGQCLYFSRPYEAWGITGSWSKAYKSFYDAAVFCLENGGYLAEQVEDVDTALQFCARLKGSCTPSLIARNGKCYQWSPIDGSVRLISIIFAVCNNKDNILGTGVALQN